MTKSILLLTLLACQNVEFGSKQGTDDEGEINQSDSVAANPSSPGKINRRLMIRSFRGLNATMSFLTDTPLQADDSKSIFGKVNHMLASDNNIESFSSTMQAGIFRLATSYCRNLKKRVKSDNNELSKFGLTGFADLNNQKTQVAEQLITSFWHDDLTVRANKKEAVNELVALADRFIEEKRDSGDAFIGMCTAALASASVTFH